MNFFDDVFYSCGIPLVALELHAAPGVRLATGEGMTP